MKEYIIFEGKKLYPMLQNIRKNYHESIKNGLDKKPIDFITESNIPKSSYANLSNSAKIYALEEIFEQASAVYGPYGGSYVDAVKGSNNEMLIRKSTDGHNFFSGLRFSNLFVETIMGLIREKTLHITSDEAKSSRDGTTSLALLSSSISKNVLMDRMVNPEAYKIPSSVAKDILEIVKVCTINSMKDNKVSVYDNTKGEYVNDGFIHALDAISTTVDHNPMFVNAYKGFMEFCVENNIDMTNAVRPSRTENVIGEENKFELIPKMGIKIGASPFNKQTARYFTNDNRPVFILNGHINEDAFEPFKKAFVSWYKEFMGMIGEDEFYAFSEYSTDPMKLKPPVFLYNRTVSSMTDMMKELESEIVLQLKNPKTGNTMEETLVPSFIFVESEADYEDIYNAFKDVFAHSIIDLNGIRRYIYDSARFNYLNNEITKKKIAEGTANTTPTINWINAIQLEELNLFPKVSKTSDLKEEIRYNTIKYHKDSAMFLTENSDCYIEEVVIPAGSLINTISFSGNIVYTNPTTEYAVNKIKERVSTLKEALKNVSSNSLEKDAIDRLLIMLSGCSVIPRITYMTHDDMDSMLDTYQDAQGCFESVHSFGVFSGGNTAYFKVESDYVVSSHAAMFKYTEGLKEEVKVKYYEFKNRIDNIVKLSYTEMYEVLNNTGQGDMDNVINLYGVDGYDMLTSLNIITNEFDTNIIEPAKTTVDIFRAAINFLYDMLTIKKVYTETPVEYDILTKDFNDRIKMTAHANTHILLNQLKEGEVDETR